MKSILSIPYSIFSTIVLCGVLFFANTSFAGELEDLTLKANQGDPDTQYNLGMIYFQGTGVSQDYKQALVWFNKAANQDHAGAQLLLGVSYSKGLGVPQDQDQALAWTTKSANQGYANAQVSLGINYYQGLGVRQDYKQALAWFTKAADQNHASAQFLLGMSYFVGTGIPQDYKQAYVWFSLAAANGQNEGVKYRDLTASELTPQQLAEAQQQVKVLIDKFEAQKQKQPNNN